jgi:hypothetical protein
MAALWPNRLLAEGGDAIPADSLAHFAPRETSVFAEVLDMRGLEREWSESDWGSALTSIVMGRTDEPGSGDEALKPLAAALGIDNPVAVRGEVFGRRAALALPSWANLDEGVLLAVPENIAPLEAVLEKRGRKPETIGKARQYKLDKLDHWLATDGRVVLLGQRREGRSLYDHAVALLAGEATDSLATDPAFQTEVAPLNTGAQRAMMYFSSTPAPATQPTATQPTASAPATTQPAGTTTAPSTQGIQDPIARMTKRWLPTTWPRLVKGAVGASVEDRLIRLDIHGQLNQAAPPHLQDANVAVLETLPATTLAAWAQAVDYPAYYRAFIRGSPTLLTLYLTYIDSRLKAAGSSLGAGLLERLGQDTIVLFGVIPEAEQTAPVGYELPALGVIVPVDDRASVASAMDVVGGSIAALLPLAGVRPKDQPNATALTKADYNGTTICAVPVGELFKRQTTCPYLHTLRLSWAVTDHDLILSTHDDHIRQIVRARAGQAPQLGPRLASAGKLNHLPPSADGVLLAQPAAIAAMFESWIAYAEARNPEVLKPEWWQARQEERLAQANLGFALGKSEPGQITVRNTLPGWPAHGRLEPGDRIVAVDGQPLAQGDAKASLRMAIVNRRDAGRITLSVIRKGTTMDVEIPIPDVPQAFDPIGAIRQINELLKPFAAASYTVWAAPPDRFNARVMLRGVQPPETQPAPATQPATTQPAPPPPPPPPPTTQSAPTPAADTQPAPAPAPAATQPATAPAA